MLCDMPAQPHSVRAIECPLSSLARIPCSSEDEAHDHAKWVAEFIQRVLGRSYEVAIFKQEEKVVSATSDEWRSFAHLNLRGPSPRGRKGEKRPADVPALPLYPQAELKTG